MGHKEKSCYIGSSFVFTISQGPYFNLKVSHILFMYGSFACCQKFDSVNSFSLQFRVYYHYTPGSGNISSQKHKIAVRGS